MRFHNWPELMAAYIKGRSARPFEFGKRAHDCCSFANQHIIEITGEDPMADIPDYVSAEEADLILADGLSDLIDARMPVVSIGRAQRGDIALARMTLSRGEEIESLMIVEGPTLVGPGLRRLERHPRGAMLRAWSV